MIQIVVCHGNPQDFPPPSWPGKRWNQGRLECLDSLRVPRSHSLDREINSFPLQPKKQGEGWKMMKVNLHRCFWCFLRSLQKRPEKVNFLRCSRSNGDVCGIFRGYDEIKSRYHGNSREFMGYVIYCMIPCGLPPPHPIPPTPHRGYIDIYTNTPRTGVPPRGFSCHQRFS